MGSAPMSPRLGGGIGHLADEPPEGPCSPLPSRRERPLVAQRRGVERQLPRRGTPPPRSFETACLSWRRHRIDSQTAHGEVRLQRGKPCKGSEAALFWAHQHLFGPPKPPPPGKPRPGAGPPPPSP